MLKWFSSPESPIIFIKYVCLVIGWREGKLCCLQVTVKRKLKHLYRFSCEQNMWARPNYYIQLYRFGQEGFYSQEVIHTPGKF